MNRATQLQIEGKVEDATRILAHYFNQTLPVYDAGSRQDLHAEMRDVVNSIVDAAVLTIEAEVPDMPTPATPEVLP